MPAPQTLLIVMPEVAWSFLQYKQALEHQLPLIGTYEKQISSPAELQCLPYRAIAVGPSTLAGKVIQLALFTGYLIPSQANRFFYSFEIATGNYAGIITDQVKIDALIAAWHLTV